MLADPVQDSGAGPMKLATWRAGGMVNSVTDEPFARFSVELDLKQRKLCRDEGIGGFMTSGFELFVAKRYLRAHRKEAVISVITAISVIGVAAGVMALVIAVAVTNGFRNTLQRSLLGAMAHINVMARQAPELGITDWHAISGRIGKVPGVVAVSPSLYEPTTLVGGLGQKGVMLKGIDVSNELAVSTALRKLKAGSLDCLRDPGASPPGIVLGSGVARDSGLRLNSNVNVIAEELTPYAPRPVYRRFRVCGIFETGFFEIDDNWAYALRSVVQRVFDVGDTVNQLEIQVNDLNRAPEIAMQIERSAASGYTTTTWMERNHQILGALRMERIVTIITIGLIELVAALNILITLVMMVMEKYRDIAVLMSMGARRDQVRRIFMLQGVLIGTAGAAIGLMLGFALSYFADQYRWIPLDPTVYSMSFVPFESRWVDGVWIAAAATLVSFLATLYPARKATRIAPTEVLRYE
jgi:lipoprotein-releasing system permease protein